MADKPKVWVVVTARCGPLGDLAGTLCDDTGEALWSHVSSSMWWLERDLTVGFADRRVDLEARYPDGYEIVVLGLDATEKDRAPLEALWDANHPGWREAEGR